jgi:plastocyanin
MVPGVTDIGNHCSSCTTTVVLPFTYNFYGIPRTAAQVSVNGTLQFNSSSGAFTNTCLPTASFADVILPYWDGLNTTVGITTTIQPGIYTSISGSTPNRIFNIEWRTCVFEGTGTTCNLGLAIFEVRLYEGQDRFDVVYDTVEAGGGFATIGVQRGAGDSYTQYSCNLADLSAGLQLLFRPYNCGEPTNTPTITMTPTPANTATSTRTTTNTATATITPGGPTLTPTASPTPTATHGPSNSVLISEFRTRGQNGAFDEFIELYNKTGSPVDISGWRLDGSSSCGTTVQTRLIITGGTSLPAYSHFLATNSQGYTGTVAGDATYTTGISDDGGIGLLNASGFVIDAVGMCITTTFHEGVPLPPFTSTANYDHSYERLLGGSAGNGVDTDNNNNDFFLNASSSNPQNLSSPPVPPCPAVTEQNNIQDFAFNPASMTIYQGTTVRWTNLDGAPHTSTSDTGLWDSGSLVQTDSFQYTFTTAGTFTYHCDIHPTMTATINVLAGCPPAVTATPTASPTATSAPSITATSTPACTIRAVGHLVWQTVPQPNARNAQPLTVTIKSGVTEVNVSTTADASGFFTVSLGTGFPSGPASWRVKGPRHLANCGTVVINADPCVQNNFEVSTMRGGDVVTTPASQFNIVNSSDFNILKGQFGQGGNLSGDLDFTLVVNSSDFNILKLNFGQAGCGPMLAPISGK